MLTARGAIAVLMAAFGITIVVRMLGLVGSGGFAIIPGLVLGAAMVALGIHRLSLILRRRRST